MVRIRNKRCSTNQARWDFAKVARIGEILKIEGVRYTAMFNGSDGKYPITSEIVRVTGTSGTVRFDGVLWGYIGEGSRGLRDLLMFCGIKNNYACFVAFTTKRRSEDGIDWTLKFNGVNCKLTPAEGLTSELNDALMEVCPYKLISRD